jgi:alpha-mannosidase
MKKRHILIVLFFLINLVNNAGFGQIPGKNHVNDTTYILTYDHGGLILWGSAHFRERLLNAVDWLDKYPSFKIGLDNEAQIYDQFAESEPALLNELKDLLVTYKNRFGIGSCTYGQPLSTFINDESNIRQVAYAIKAERKYFNYRPPVYLMSEHAMHSQIPQIIKGFGFKGAIMRTHFMMYGYNPTFNVPIGWWIGLDGSKIAAIPTYDGEGAAFGKTTMDNWILTRYPGDDSRESMEVFRNKFKNINPLLASRADDSGLRKEALVKEYENKPKYVWILLDDLLSRYPPPVKNMVTGPNDFVVRMPWGYCGNEIWNESRKAEISVQTAERLAAVEFLNGGESHEDDLEISWKKLLLAQHHDIQIVGLLPEARRLLPESINKSESTIKKSMSFFADNMAGEGFRHAIVFNPLSWEQTKWIILKAALQKGDAKSFVAKCGEKILPVIIVESDKFSDGSILDATLTFKADLPPLSISSYSVLPADSRIEAGDPIIKVMEEKQVVITPFYEVKLSDEGGLTSIRDTKTGKLITAGDKRSVYFEGLINGINCQSSGSWVIKKSDEGTPWVTIKEYGFISDIPYTFTMTFYADNPRIDCKANFEFNGQFIGLLSDNLRDDHSPFIHEEKLRFKFFPNLDTGATGIRDLPFAVARTENKYIEGNYWTALTDSKSGVAFFNTGTMGSIHEKDNSFSIPLAYSMYYIWGTRILYGPYNYEFAILPFSGNLEEKDLHKKALEYSFNVPVIEIESGNNNQEYMIRTFSLDYNNDIILTGLYPEDGKVIAHFFKCGDKTGITSFHFGKPGAEIVETDLEGKYIRKVDDKIDFRPWEIKSLQVINR